MFPKWYFIGDDAIVSYDTLLMVSIELTDAFFKRLDAFLGAIEPDSIKPELVATEIKATGHQWLCAEYSDILQKIGFNRLIFRLADHPKHKLMQVSYSSPSYLSGLVVAWYLTCSKEGKLMLGELVNESLY